MTVEIGNPFRLFLNARGDLLDGGKVFIGTSGADPETSPIACFFDAALTIPAAQPLVTRGGYIMNGSAPARVFTAAADYSIRVRDSDDSQVFYTASAVLSGPSFQPLDADLTAIAALTTTAYGRSLLTMADAAALRSAAGISPALPLTGGTVTGNIVRGSAGTHIYHNNAALTDGRIFITDASAAAPTAGDGAIWFKRKT
ncbi:Bacteriophage P22 tailspike, N-terminal [uncultured Caudovirales phage]|uniref:Bacteriophage P22 tailspike, N-terminal n=1 Tax=uncultured Caudovirales phage TaxID=2100421 RepID=A0A6J5M3S5_9CAUD|nr:Bacteriophage P22 tailspike, N-terminal [uncultured Caudovirales phage]